MAGPEAAAETTIPGTVLCATEHPRGGMGFTGDMLPNDLVKWAWVLEQSFGPVDDHALRIGETIAGAHA